MRYYFTMDFMAWFLGLWVFGAIVLRKRIQDWRQSATDPAVKNWFGLGLVGFCSMLFFNALLGSDGTSWMYMLAAAALLWVAFIAGMEAMARDARARAQQQRSWEERQRAEARRQVAQVYSDRASRRSKDKAAAAGRASEYDEPEIQLHQPAAGPHGDDVTWPLSAARVSVEGGTTEIDLTRLFFPEGEPAAPANAPAAELPQALTSAAPTRHTPHAPQPPRQQRREVQAAPAVIAAPVHSVNLNVTSRFGSNAPAATAPVTLSVRQTEAVEAAPTLPSEQTHMAEQEAEAAPAETIELPETSMPETTPVGTAPLGVQSLQPPRVLGPTTLGRSGTFHYQPRMVQSKLGSGAPKPAPQEPGPGQRES